MKTMVTVSIGEQTVDRQVTSAAEDRPTSACSGPIPSMIAVIEHRLNVPIVWSTPDEVDANIDGASTIDPIPAVLVNLVGGRERWWRTRMTLAHELCHLLYVRTVQEDRIVLDRGQIVLTGDDLVINCTASGISRKPLIPIWADKRITVELVKFCQPLFSAALLASWKPPSVMTRCFWAP